MTKMALKRSSSPTSVSKFASSSCLEKRSELPSAAKKEAAEPKRDEVYTFCEPASKLTPSEHFSGLLLSGDVGLTILEVSLLLILALVAIFYGDELDMPQSMPFSHLAAFFWVTSFVTRLYITYLEACYFSFPQYRTQAIAEHKVASKKDICGRDQEQLDFLVRQDRMTLISQLAFGILIYFCFPGYYPSPGVTNDPMAMRIVKLIFNHYVMSFGMYWGHRAYHKIPFLWKFHSVHHWGKHPLSRNTYEDHWVENFVNHVQGHFAAQILVPLDFQTFWFSHIFRILESLEKHSGISCWLNIAHQTQCWIFPFAQMPHHHDWHHEGHKGSNYSFSSLGGVWDVVFGTRKQGRGCAFPTQSTYTDREQERNKSRTQNHWIDDPKLVLVPSVVFAAIWACELYECGGAIA